MNSVIRLSEATYGHVHSFVRLGLREPHDWENAVNLVSFSLLTMAQLPDRDLVEVLDLLCILHASFKLLKHMNTCRRDEERLAIIRRGTGLLVLS